MKNPAARSFFTWWLGAALMATSAGASHRPQPVPDQCRPEQKALIEAEGHCVQAGGIDIGNYSDEGMTVACLQSKRVQGLCGPDGQLTRLHAYQDWLGKLTQFESRCAQNGGVFSYQDPRFNEPQDESYCLQAQPEITSNTFEQPLCNYRSVCPAVAVSCEYPCRSEKTALTEDIPAPTSATLAAATPLNTHRP